MRWNSRLSLFFFLVALAAAGYGLGRLVPTVVAEYRQASEFSPAWGYVYVTGVGIGAAAFAMLAIWAGWTIVANTRSKAGRRASESRNPSQMSCADRQTEIESRLAESRALADDETFATEVREPIKRSISAIETKLETQSLEIVAFGTVSSGKSSLLNALAGRDVFRTDAKAGTTLARNEIPWPGVDRVTLVDTPGLAEVHGATREELAKRESRDADLVLFVVDGPLKDFEFEVLKTLAAMEKRCWCV